MNSVPKDNLIRLMKLQNGNYVWCSKNNYSEEMSKGNALAFGVWWLRLSKKNIETGFELMADKHNFCAFSEKGDFLYVDTIPKEI